MTREEIIKTLRLLINGGIVKDEEIKLVLQRHGCYYLLEHMADHDMQLRMKLLVNRGTVSTRYE